MLRPPATSTLFPYTTLFRSGARGRRPDDHHHAALQHRPGGPAMSHSLDLFGAASPDGAWTVGEVTRQARSEEHTSELQSRQYLVCRLLLEKKNRTIHEPQPS